MLTVRERIELLPLAKLPCLPAGMPLLVGKDPCAVYFGYPQGYRDGGRVRGDDPVCWLQTSSADDS